MSIIGQKEEEVLLTDAFDRYRREVILFRSQSPKTEEHHTLALRSFVHNVGDIPLSELNFEHIRIWKEKMDAQNKSIQTIRGYLIKLRVVLSHCLKTGIQTLNPDLIPLPKRIERPPAWVSPEDVSKLIKATNKPRNKAIISLLYASGIRVSELCQLNRGDIKDRKFTVKGKGNKYRLAFIDERTETYLQDYLRKRKDHLPALFIQRITHQRIHKSGVQEIFRYACKNSNLQCITPHTMRHSFATDLVNKGMPIHSVSKLLGHSNIATTSIYLHIAYPQLEEEYNRYHTQ